MFKSNLLSVAVLLLIFTVTQGILAEDAPVLLEALPQIEVVESGDDGVSFVFELGDLPMEEIAISGEAFQKVSIPGGVLRGDVGQPGIPTFSRFVAIPDEGGYQVRVIPEVEETISGVHLMPIQEDESNALAYDASAYARSGYGTEPLARAGDPGILRDLRVVALTFQPVQYSPAQRELRIIRKMRVEVEFGGENSLNTRSGSNRPVPESFHRLYQDVVLNYEHFREQEITNGTYLIICRNNTEVEEALEPLVEWRQRCGTPVILATTAETGTTANSIKNYIADKYLTSDPPLEHVVLVGDAGGTLGIPTWTENMSGYYGEGDHPYTKLVGGDMLSDVHIGRLSFGTVLELERIVRKIVGYESDPYMEDQSWFKRACLVGDPSDSGWSVVHVMQWVKTRLLQMGYTEIDTIWADDVGQMIPAFNKGDTIIGYRGFWHMSGWSNTQTYQMTNGWKLPFVVTVTCDTGSFASGTSISEGFLRAWNSGADVPRGGVGCIGTATIGTHTRYNNCIVYGIYQGLLYENQHTMGAALTRGKLEAYLNYGAWQPDWAEITAHWNNLMGGSAVPIWTDVPTPLVVSHPLSIPLGTNAVTVSVQDGINPVAGAKVCLWKGVSQTYVVGFTDSHGEIELPVNTGTIGEMLITVTKHNRGPYMSSINVQNSAAYVGYRDSNIDDDNNGTSSGNGDGVVNPGETIELPVQVQNFGVGPADNVTALLTTSDPYVTILDAEEDYGDIPGGGVVWGADDFDFLLDPSCQHGHTIRFGLEVSSDQGDWHSLIDVDVTSADLVAESTTLYDAGPNGIMDPGETVELSVEVRNDGGASAQGTIGILSSLSPFVFVDDGVGVYGSIGVGGTGENTSDRFIIRADAATYEGHLATFQLVLNHSSGRTDTTHVELTVGTRSTDDPVGPDRYGYLAFDNTDTSYPEAPVYEWIEIDPGYGGDGVEVVLGDNGSYQDKSRVVDLPFTFKYYGEEFDKATICSNGWIAMGSTYLVNYRNWSIPGAGGPDGMIAPFWDDLYQSGGAKAWQKYDEQNHRWIVEWSRFRNDYNGATEVFEVILLDPEHYVTDSGDGKIIFQYHTVSNYDPVNGYATVGIESPSNLDGLLYTYWNWYPEGAATLQAGRAIHFVPAIEGPFGTLNGTVTNSSAGESPIPGATITLLERGRSWTTDANGNYGGMAPVGTFTVTAEQVSFQPDTAYGVVIEQGQETDLDFSLVDILGPIIETTPHPSTSDTLGPYPIPVTLQEYSGLEEAILYYRVEGVDFTSVPLTPLGGDDYMGEIPGQDYVSYVEYYVYARDILGLETTDPPGAPGELFSFFVAPTLTVFEDDMESDQGWTVGAPGDDASTGIWERVDPNGTWSGSDPVQPEDDHTPNPGVMCFVTGNAPPGSGQGEDDVDDGKTTLTSPILDMTGGGDATLTYYRWYSNNTGNSPNQDIWQVLISSNGGDSWTSLENTTVTEQYWKLMEFNLGDYITLTDQVQLRFIASDEGDGSIVEAAVDDLEIIMAGVSDASDEISSAPIFLLFQNRPNPAASSTVIRFGLDRPGQARLAVFDVQGRLVRSLMSGRRDAGLYTVIWDGRNGEGHFVPSGTYFYKLEAGERTLTKKMMLLK